jgi:hypothetical protein
MMEQIVAARVARNLPGTPTVKSAIMDWGTKLGVAIEFDDGKRHGVRVKIERDDLTMAADLAAEALADWMRGNGRV